MAYQAKAQAGDILILVHKGQNIHAEVLKIVNDDQDESKVRISVHFTQGLFKGRGHDLLAVVRKGGEYIFPREVIGLVPKNLAPAA